MRTMSICTSQILRALNYFQGERRSVPLKLSVGVIRSRCTLQSVGRVLRCTNRGNHITSVVDFSRSSIQHCPSTAGLPLRVGTGITNKSRARQISSTIEVDPSQLHWDLILEGHEYLTSESTQSDQLPFKMSSTTMTTTQTQKQLTKYTLSAKTRELIDLEYKYCAGGFQPLPAFFVRGKGCRLWVSISTDPSAYLPSLTFARQDVDGKEYLDFIAMFSAVNTGQCNPKIMQAVTESMQQSKQFEL